MMTVVEEQTRPAPLQQTTTVSTHALTAVTTKYTPRDHCGHYVGVATMTVVTVDVAIAVLYML